MTKAARAMLRTTTAVLWVLLLIVYVAAKVNFFTRYSPNGVADYLRQHTVYWLAMAAIAFTMWVVQKLFPEEPRRL